MEILETTQPVEPTTEPQPVAPAEPVSQFAWKSHLGPDMQNSPLVQKFDDSKEGLSKAVEAHLNLEKLLGHEKIPIPQGPDDKEGIARYKKAMKIPDNASGYQLEDFQMPESMQESMPFTKDKFAEIMASNGATPDQATGLWKAYNETSKQSYDKVMQDYQGKVDGAINTLRQEWGDAFESNVKLGETVINKFSKDKETNDFLTSTLSADPRGIKFLQSIGKQFAENNIGDFDVKRFSLSPSEAKSEHDKILVDSNHPYNNEKATAAEHKEAVNYVNRLIGLYTKA